MEITRLAPALGMVGGILALTGLLLLTFFPEAGWIVTGCEVLALICLAAFFTIHFQSIKVFSARRTTRLGFNSIMSVILAFAILVIINFLAARHAPQWDLSETQHFTLTRQTYQVLRELKREVTIKVFAHERSPLFGSFRDLFSTYTNETPKLTVEFIDPEKQPEVARAYEISRIDTAVFESGSQKIYLNEASEKETTNALLRVTRDSKKRLVFLTGHGERSLLDQQQAGYSRAKEALSQQGYDVETAKLLDESTLAKDTKLVVLASPQQPLTEHERINLGKFLKSGGRLLVLADPQDQDVLESLTAQWGIALGKGIVVDERDRLGRGSPTALLIRTFTGHDITEDFTTPILLPVSRYIDFNPEKGKNWEFVSLAQTSPESWAEINLAEKTPTLNPEEDLKGPFTIAGALSPQMRSPNPSHDPAMVIVGNSAFASNGYLNYPGNTDFFLNIVAWLAEEGQLVSITPKEPAFRPFVPNPSQEQALLFFQVLFLPSLTLFIGFSVWRKRRRL